GGGTPFRGVLVPALSRLSRRRHRPRRQRLPLLTPLWIMPLRIMRPARLPSYVSIHAPHSLPLRCPIQVPRTRLCMCYMHSPLWDSRYPPLPLHETRQPLRSSTRQPRWCIRHTAALTETEIHATLIREAVAVLRQDNRFVDVRELRKRRFQLSQHLRICNNT